METVTRKCVPLDRTLADLVASLRTPGSAERLALAGVVGPLPSKLTEAAAMALLMNLGRDVIQEAQSAASYAASAAARTAEDFAWDKEVRRRRARDDREAWGYPYRAPALDIGATTARDRGGKA